MATLDQEPGMSDGMTTSKEAPPPLGGTRAQAAQRLQMGVGGVLAITLLVGLASLIEGRADETQDDAVPQAAATSEPEVEQTQSDPLVEAGVVPDLPSAQVSEIATEEPILPEQGIVQDMEEAVPAKSGNGGQSDQDETVDP
ncbi:hypothetical protein ACRAQ7_01470 [Erythrobacter sp. W53]|uniref:hypothetical protein n=1 Tax=Erythrobacteraceae TaxID=335929 RepID=UPI0036D34DD0